MHGEIITIGNELISGRATDTNSSHAAKMLTNAGLDVICITSVGDDSNMVSYALHTAMKRSEFAVITGGLGSTDDDITAKIVANALNCQLELNKETLDNIKKRQNKANMPLSSSLEKMAWLPKGSTPLDKRGDSCGFFLKKDGVLLFFLPGVPEQARRLLKESVIPKIKQHDPSLPLTCYRVFKLYGLKEPSIAEKFKALRGKTGKAVVGFYPRFPENHITVTLKGNNRNELEQEMDRIEGEIRSVFDFYIFATDNQTMEDATGDLLIEKGLSVSVAESCTGGMVGSRFTNVPGSSGYFMGGVVAYSNECKVRLIHVRQKTLDTYGAVSTETAEEMAVGVREVTGSDISVSVTGIAGPEGGSREKPVGTVCFGLASKDSVLSGRYLFSGDRRHVRINASTMAIDWIRRYINGISFLPGI